MPDVGPWRGDASIELHEYWSLAGGLGHFVPGHSHRLLPRLPSFGFSLGDFSKSLLSPAKADLAFSDFSAETAFSFREEKGLDKIRNTKRYCSVRRMTLGIVQN